MGKDKSSCLNVKESKTSSWQDSEAFPGGSEVKVSACSAGDLGLIPGSGRSPGEGNGNSLQYSCLENPMDRGAWWAIVHGVAKNQTQLSDFTSLLQDKANCLKILDLLLTHHNYPSKSYK